MNESGLVPELRKGKSSSFSDVFAALSKGCLYIYALLLIVVEARVGTEGISFPVLTAGVSDVSVGLLFLGEVPLLGVVVFALISWLGRQTDLELTARRDLIRPSSRGRPSAVVLWAMATLIWCSVVIFGAVVLQVPQASSAMGHARMLLEGLGLLVSISSLSWRIKEVGRVLGLLLFGGLLHASIIVLSFLQPSWVPFETNVIEGYTSRFSGLFMQPSRAGFVLGLSLIIALSQVWFAGVEGLRKGYAYFGLIAIFAALLLTQTRSTVVAFAFGALFLFIEVYRRRGIGRFVSVGLVMMFLVTSFSLVFRNILIEGFGRFSGSDISDTGRSNIFPVALDLILRYPFGLGVGGLETHSGDLLIPHAHNMYLQVGVMFGIPGLLGFMGLLWMVWRRGESCPVGSVTGWVWSGLRGCFIFSLVAFMAEPFLITNVGAWFWILCGLLMASVETGRVSSKPSLG